MIRPSVGSQGDGMPAFYQFIYYLCGKKGFQNHNFSKAAINLTTLITPIIDTNSLISYGNQIHKTNLIKNYLIAKVFAKMPISA